MTFLGGNGGDGPTSSPPPPTQSLSAFVTLTQDEDEAEEDRGGGGDGAAFDLQAGNGAAVDGSTEVDGSSGEEEGEGPDYYDYYDDYYPVTFYMFFSNFKCEKYFCAKCQVDNSPPNYIDEVYTDDSVNWIWKTTTEDSSAAAASSVEGEGEEGGGKAEEDTRE